MSVIDDFTKVVTDTAKTVSKKSSDMVEVTKLSLAINTEEDRIQKQFYEIGKSVYADYTEETVSVSGEVLELCKSIHALESNINDMRSKILSLRKIKECPSCKEILDIDMVFCFKCGESRPVEAIIVEETEVPQESSEGAESEVREEVHEEACSCCNNEANENQDNNN